MLKGFSPVSNFLVDAAHSNASDALTKIYCGLDQKPGNILLRHYGHEEEYGIDVSLMLGSISYISVNIARLLNIDIMALSNHGIDYSRPAGECISRHMHNLRIIDKKMLAWLKDEGVKHLRKQDIAFLLSSGCGYLLAQINDYRKGIIGQVSDVLSLRQGIPASLIGKQNQYCETVTQATGDTIEQVAQNLVRSNKPHMMFLKETIEMSVNVLQEVSTHCVNDAQKKNDSILKRMQDIAQRLNYLEHYGDMQPIDYNNLHNAMASHYAQGRIRKFSDSKTVKTLKKRLLRGMGLYRNIFGKDDIKGFINGETMTIEGHQFLYRLTKNKGASVLKASDTSGYHSIPYELWVVSKGTGQRVARLCIYIPDIPILDQIVALGVRVKSCEHEIDMLKTANIMARGDSEEISIIDGYQKSRLGAYGQSQEANRMINLLDGYEDAREEIRRTVETTINQISLLNQRVENIANYLNECMYA